MNLILPIQISDEVVDQKAKIFADELGGWSHEVIQRAFRQHSRSSRFMPTLSEIISLCNSISADVARGLERLQLDEPQPDEAQRLKNVERLKEIKKILAGKKIKPSITTGV